MQNKYSILLLSLFIVSCATPVKKTITHDKLFPDGIYRQRIELEILKKGKPTAGFPFTSISRIEKGKFEILGLSPFGTTVFEASGDIDKPEDLKIKFHINPPAFLKESFIKKTFAELNHLYLLKESDLKKEDNYDSFKNETLKMKIYKYNTRSIPSVIKLTAEKWRAYVQTQSFKDLK